MKAIELLKIEYIKAVTSTLGQLKLYNAKREFSLTLGLVTTIEVETMENEVNVEFSINIDRNKLSLYI